MTDIEARRIAEENESVLCTEVERCHGRIVLMGARMKEMRQALVAYADEGNWTGVDGNTEPDIPALWTPTDRDTEEPGPTRACAALRKHGGGA